MNLQAGALRERISILLPVMAADGSVSWQKERGAWANAEYLRHRLPYSAVGAAGDGVKLTTRAMPFDKSRCILWRGQYFAPVDVDDTVPGWLTISAARAHAVTCVGDTGRFPAFLTEKWVRYSQELPMDINVTTYVLVTPKIVRLRPGSLVDVDGITYHVQTTHDLKDTGNEYELVRTVDL